MASQLNTIQGIQTEEEINLIEFETAVITLEDQSFEIQQTNFGVNPAFDLIGLTDLRNDPQFAGIDGSGVSVVVIDTGLDQNHPLLAPNYLNGFDFVNNSNNPIDTQGHGTHVSGIVGAADPNIGVAPDVGLIGLQVFEDSGTAFNSTIEDALEWVLDNQERYNIVAVNLSLGAGFFTSESNVFGDLLIDDIQRLEEEGVTVVAAAGNSFSSNQSQNLAAPAIYSTLAVGAVWQDGVNSNVRFSSGATDFTTGADRLTSFTQRLDDDHVIFAPGAFINSTVPGGGFEQFAGTSQASPIVAGSVALLQEIALEFGGRLLSPEEIVDIITSTGDRIFDGDDENDNVNNTNTDYLRLNIHNAALEVQRRFGVIAPPSEGGIIGDANGTITGAIFGPILDGRVVNPIAGSIGIDGNSTNIGNTDVDIFRFEVVSPSNVNIEVISNASNPDDFDSFLRLFDASGNELISDDDGGEGLFSEIDIELDPGTYFVGVSGFNNSNYNPNIAGSGVAGETGNYALDFNLINDDSNGIISGAIPVNLGSNSDPLTFSGFIGDDLGNSVGGADVDLYEIVVPDNGVLFIDIDTPFLTDFVDSFLRLFDANGNALFFSNGSLAESDNNLSFDVDGNLTEFTDFQFPGFVFDEPNDRTFFSGHDTDSFLGIIVERGDVFHIGVSDSANQNYDPNNLNNRSALGSGGSYDLIIDFVNNDVNGSITQAVSGISLPLIGQGGSIGFDNSDLAVGDRDVDFVRINSENAGILEIDIDSLGDFSNQNPVNTSIFLFDGDGNQIAFNDDNFNDDNQFGVLDPLLQIPIEANQDYFVAITGFGNDNFDPFQLGSGSGGETGDYTFNSSLLPLTQISNLSDNIINNNGVQSVSIGDEIFANIGSDNSLFLGDTDVDIYSFIPSVSQRVNIFTTTNEQFSTDTFLRLFDANGNELAANDDRNNTTRGSLLQVDVTAGQEYFIGINGAGDEPSDYNPITGDGVNSGVEGDYILGITEFQEFVNSDATIDIDNNGEVDALTDGLLIIRHLFGFTEDSLVNGVLASNAQRNSPSEIGEFLFGVEEILDVDDNGNVDALTDGLLIIRHLFGFTGNSLVNGVVANDAERDSASEIQGYLDSIIPSGDFG